MPNVELFSYTTICSSFKWIEPLFLSYHVHRHTHTLTHTDRKTDRHTAKGSHNTELKKQLNRLFAKLAPSVKLNIIFSASNKLSKLCKLKCTLPIVKQSNVIYKVACGNCTEFYIGKTNRRLQTHLNEHKKDVKSALNEHSILTDHSIDYAGVKLLAKDSHNYMYILLINETLKIQEQYAFN